MSSYRHQFGYTPSPQDLRDMQGGKLRIKVDRSRGPGRGKVDIDMDNILGIKEAVNKLSDFFTFRDMAGAGAGSSQPKPKQKTKSQKNKK